MTQSSSPRPRLLVALRTLALVILVGTAGFWAAKGAHRGWSQNRVPVSQTDEITGIDYITYEERFVPGVDVLAAGAGLATALFALSFFIRSKNSTSTP
jgi:hypothetical protein